MSIQSLNSPAVARGTLLHGVSRRELVTFICRYWRPLGVALFVPLLITMIAAFVVQPLYSASSVLIVRMGPEYIYQPESNLSPLATQQALPLSQQQIFKSELAMLDSADLHREAIRKTGIARLYPALANPSLLKSLLGRSETDPARFEADALERFEKDYDVQLQKDSAVITLTYRHAQPDVARQLLSDLLAAYIERRQSLYAHQGGAVTKNAADAAYRRMTESEKAVAAYKRDHAIYAVEAEQASLMQTHSELERKRSAINSASLDDSVSEIEVRLGQLRDAQHELVSLENAAKVARDEYAILLNRSDQASLQANLESEKNGSIRIVQAPAVSGHPKSWRSLIIVLGGIVSLLSLITAAAVIDYRRTTFSSPEDIERVLGLKVLASLPLQR